jgi:hypothetical protein
VTASDSGRAPVPWRAIIAGGGILGGEGAAAVVHPALGEALVAADAIGPLAIALILLAAVLLGSDETVDRVFRLLRWAANRSEPAAPPATPKPGTLPVPLDPAQP